MADSQGLGETMTGKERGYPMHTVSMPLQSCYGTVTHSGKTGVKNKAFHNFIVKY